MKKIYAYALLFLPFLGMSQQGVQFTQYMFNKIYYNPGVAGSGGAICVNSLYRNQWVGFEGAPTTINANVNAPIKKLHGGLFLSIASDQIGFFQNTEVGIGYAYQLQLDNGTLGIGASLNIRNKGVDKALWIPSEQDFSDQSLTTGTTSGTSYDPNFGVFYESENIWGGVSYTNLSSSSTDLDGLNNNVIQFSNASHFYIMGGYNWEVPATNWTLMPSTLIKTDFNSSPTFDVNIMGMYNNKFWGGVTYRLQDAVAVNFGYQVFPSLKAGYSYDVGTSSLSQQGGGSHEIMLKYCFKIEITPPQKGSYKNPRFL